MRILVIHNGGDPDIPSGEYIAAENCFSILRKAEIETNFLHIQRSFNYERSNFAKKFSKVFSLFWSLSAFKLIDETIKNFKPDLAHFHGVYPDITISGFYACKKNSIPVIQTLHNLRWVCIEGGYFRKDTYCDLCSGTIGWQGLKHRCAKNNIALSIILFFINFWFRKTLSITNFVDRFIAVSNFIRNEHIRVGFPPGKIVTIYNTNHTNSNIAIKKIIPNKYSICFIGRLCSSKGTKTLMKLFLEQDIFFNIVGSGPDLDLLIKYSEENHLKNIKFYGRLDNKKTMEVLSNSECCLIPSICGEACSLVAIESMMLSKPIICSDVGGLNELVKSSGAGILIHRSKPDDFIKAIRTLAGSTTEIQKMRNNGWHFYQSHLNNSRHLYNLLQTYKDVLRKTSHINS